MERYLIDTLNSNSIKRIMIEHNEGTDLNTITQVGFHTIPAPTNSPIELAIWTEVIVLQAANNPDYVAQILIDHNSQLLYFRVSIGGAWEHWSKIVTESLTA